MKLPAGSKGAYMAAWDRLLTVDEVDELIPPAP
jgi:hypothetical protein